MIVSFFRTALAVCVAAAAALPVLGAQTAKKPAAAKATAKKAPAPKKPVGPVPADTEQIAAAEWVYYGTYECEFNQKVDISINPKYPAYADVRFLKSVYLMKPVLSSTGAIRLEDVKGQTVMIQIANKSMLMDVKAGRRLVDDCVGQRQRELMEAARQQRERELQTGAMPGAEPLLQGGAVTAVPAMAPAPDMAASAGLPATGKP